MATTSSVEIYCPACQWEPDGGTHWQCRCGHVWDTFETAGTCPQCRHRWAVTMCPSEPGGCGVTSPHIDWYHGLDALVEELMEAALPAPVAVGCPQHES